MITEYNPKHYTGVECKKCGHTTRLISTTQCTNCKRQRKLKFGKMERERDKHKIIAYRQRSKGLQNAHKAKRRSRKLKATPSWYDHARCVEIYDKSEEMGSNYHVDHIYPLKSHWVCGLHTHENLKIITKSENLTKSNRYMEKWHG